MTEEVDEKLRIRSEDELKGQAAGLVIVRQILEENNITCFVAGGTLLGMIREGDFIKWDWDVEINVRTEDALPKFNKLLHAFKKKGFDIVKFVDAKENFKIVVSKFETKYEILGYYLKGEKRMRKKFQMPAYLFSKGKKVELRGEFYDVLNPPEEYLSCAYGDWQTPMRSADKQEYMTEGFRRDIPKKKSRKNMLKKFFGKIKKKVFNYL